MTDERVTTDARVIWEYMILHELVTSADMLLVLGSIDERVAVYAAELSRTYNYGLVLFTGGVAHANDLLRVLWDESEAEHFHDIFMKSGGKAKQVVFETAEQNTGQNAVLSYEAIKQSGLALPRTIEIVTKPYMERRARATFEVQWPDKQTQFFVTSPRITFDDYPNSKQPFDVLVNIMIGDFERILKYPELSLQSRQIVLAEVMKAWHRLTKAGYNEHRI